MFILGTIRKNAEVGSRGRTGLPRCIILWALALLLSAPLLRADDIGDLQSKADAWISKSKEIYRLDCDDMRQIRDAYCSQNDVTEESGRVTASDVATQMKRDAKDPILDQLKGYDRLKSDAERLNTGSTAAQAAKILAAIKVEYDRLTKLKNGYWFGANNPLIQYAIEYGKDRHAEMGRNYDCDVVDKEFPPGASKRPDCVSAKKCTIFEFKPKNDRAIAKGKDQLEGYQELVDQYYSDVITHKKTPEREYGGSEIVKKIHQQKCYEGNWPDGGDPIGEIKVKFEGRVETYQPCEDTYECTRP